MYDGADLTEYAGRLYAAAVGKAGDPNVAEELAQETFVAALQAFRRGFYPDNLWAWLLRVLSNKHCDYLREKYGRPQLSFDAGLFELADPRGDFAEDLAAGDAYAESLASVRRELGYLAKTHREVMTRFYMRGHSVKRIADELGIPAGTVKSRLNTARRAVREGVKEMENYTKQSYEPDILHLSCSGDCGLDDAPFTLVRPDDRLTQNILIMAYDAPVTEAELSKALGIPAAYIEPAVGRLVGGELMLRTGGGKVYTNFIVYTEKDLKANFKEQLEAAEQNFKLFWKEVGAGLEALREAGYYRRHNERARKKLELHFAVNTLLDACALIRDEITGPLPFEEYPYRKDGGRWYAMGFRYPPDYDFGGGFTRYMISGEACIELKNFNGSKLLQLRKYDTDLGGYPNSFFFSDYVKWLFEIEKRVPPEASAVGPRVLEAAGALIDSGILTKNGAVSLDIPVLTPAEYRAKRALSSGCSKKAAAAVREVLLKLYRGGCVRLPKHLTGVPRFQQYLFSGDSVPMAVIYKAMEQGLFLEGVDYPVPASILVADE